MTENHREDHSMTAVGDKQILGTQTPPKVTAARSRGRNSFARIVILGMILFSLSVLIDIALFVRPENVKDLIWAVIAVVAYLAASAEASRKNEK
jgi:hypothetical protein